MRLSTVEKTVLLQLLCYDERYVMVGDCGKIPNQRTIDSLTAKGLLNPSAWGVPYVAFHKSQAWDCRVGRSIIKEAQAFLDEVDNNGDPSLLEEPRLTDSFEFALT